MSNTLKSKYGAWALITGASDGIGKAIAFDLAERGLNLILVARNASALEKIGHQLSADYKVEIRPLPLDLSKPEANESLIKAAQSVDLGIFIAAAGFGTSGDFISNPVDNELNMIDLNCRAVVEETHAIARQFRDRGRGAIVLFSSLFAFQGVPGSAAYSATKSFIQNFGEGLQVELKPYGIDVLIAAPGPVVTGFGSRADMKYRFGEKASTVSRSIVANIGKSMTLRPGPIAKILEFALASAFFRKIRSFILGTITRDMTQHQVKR